MKKYVIIIAFFAFMVAHYQYNYVDNDTSFYIIAGVLLLGSLWMVIMFLLAWKLERMEPEFHLDKMLNKKIQFQFNTEKESFSSVAESFYMITETEGTTGHCYINSLEVTDLDNQEAVNDLNNSLGASWDINSNRDAINQIKALIESAEKYPEVKISEIMTIKEIEDYRKYISSYQLTILLKGSEAISAFNLIRASWLVRASFSCGYLNEFQAREYITKISHLIRQQFSSWEELAASYLVMYLEWNGGLNGMLGNVIKKYAAKERVLGAKFLFDSPNSPLINCSFFDRNNVVTES